MKTFRILTFGTAWIVILVACQTQSPSKVPTSTGTSTSTTTSTSTGTSTSTTTTKGCGTGVPCFTMQNGSLVSTGMCCVADSICGGPPPNIGCFVGECCASGGPGLEFEEAMADGGTMKVRTAKIRVVGHQYAAK